MRFRSSLMLSAFGILALSGCSGNKDKIEQTAWVSLAANVKGQELPAGARQLQFGKDGHLLLVANAKPYKGAYALGMGPSVTFTFEEEYEGRKTHVEKVVVEGDTLVLTNPDGSEIPFQKVH